MNIDNATSRAFSMATIYDPNKGDMEASEAFKQLSRLKFAREKEFVEREIYRRVGAVAMKDAANASDTPDTPTDKKPPVIPNKPPAQVPPPK